MELITAVLLTILYHVSKPFRAAREGRSRALPPGVDTAQWMPEDHRRYQDLGDPHAEYEEDDPRRYGVYGQGVRNYRGPRRTPYIETGLPVSRRVHATRGPAEVTPWERYRRRRQAAKGVAERLAWNRLKPESQETVLRAARYLLDQGEFDRLKEECLLPFPELRSRDERFERFYQEMEEDAARPLRRWPFYRKPVERGPRRITPIVARPEDTRNLPQDATWHAPWLPGE